MQERNPRSAIPKLTELRMTREIKCVAGGAGSAADEVSASIAAAFSAHATAYQTLSAQASALHQQFVSTLGASGRSYGSAEN